MDWSILVVANTRCMSGSSFRVTVCLATFSSTACSLSVRTVCAPLPLVALQGQVVVSGVGFRSCTDAEPRRGCAAHHAAARKL